MQNSTLFRRAAALLLTAALALTLVLPGLAAYEMPIQTVNEGESVYLFNADIDKPILEVMKNSVAMMKNRMIPVRISAKDWFRLKQEPA